MKVEIGLNNERCNYEEFKYTSENDEAKFHNETKILSATEDQTGGFHPFGRPKTRHSNTVANLLQTIFNLWKQVQLTVSNSKSKNKTKKRQASAIGYVVLCHLSRNAKTSRKSTRLDNPAKNRKRQKIDTRVRNCAISCQNLIRWLKTDFRQKCSKIPMLELKQDYPLSYEADFCNIHEHTQDLAFEI